MSYHLDLHDDVEIISLRTGRARYAIWKIIKIIQKVKPDIIIDKLSVTRIIKDYEEVFLKVLKSKYEMRKSQTV